MKRFLLGLLGLACILVGQPAAAQLSPTFWRPCHTTGGGGSSTPTHIQTAIAPDRGAGSDTSVTLSFGSAISTGDWAGGLISFDNTSGAIASIVDDKGNIYSTPPGAKTNDGTDTATLQLFYVTNVTNGAKTITVNFSGTVGWETMIIDEFSGVNVSAAVDGSSANSADPGESTDALTSGTATVSVTGELVYGGMRTNNGSAPGTSIGTGFTIGGNSNAGTFASTLTEFLVASGTSPTAATFTLTQALRSSAAVMTFRPGTAGGSSTCS